MNKTVSSNRCRCCFITLLYFGESEGGRLRVEGLVLRVYGLGFRLSSGIYQSLIPVTRGVEVESREACQRKKNKNVLYYGDMRNYAGN